MKKTLDINKKLIGEILSKGDLQEAIRQGIWDTERALAEARNESNTFRGLLEQKDRQIQALQGKTH